jgi:nucleotide-binding universal stress UspA family protein
MFEKILFPTDFSAHAQAELDCLTGFPEVREIILLTIVKKYPVPMAKVMIEGEAARTMTGYLEDARRHLNLLNPAITVSLETATSSDIAGSILNTAVKCNADLIVISGYVRNFQASVLLGRVPATVLCRISSTNVLVMPNLLIDSLDGETYSKFCRSIFSRLLCPTDFSECSLRSIACTKTVPGVQEILLLHVIPGTADAQDRAEAEKRLSAVRDTLAGSGIPVRMLVAGGEPAREISRVAEEEDVSVIWMSNSMKGCLFEFLSGSLVHDVVMNDKRPALICRSPE